MQRSVTRRHFLATSSLAASAVWLDRRGVFGQEAALPALVVQSRAAAATAKVLTKPLRGGVSCLYGSGGNIAVLPGKDGKLVIDSGYSTSRPQISAALDALSAEPIKHLINTHWHFDHTDGNAWMHEAGATIVAQENTKQRLSTAQTVAFLGTTFPPSPAGAIPTEVFSDRKTVTVNGETLLLHHFEPAHTDTDIAIYFTGADVLHVGDTWFNKFYPFIDYSSGGSIDGMIRATERNLADAGAKTIIIPGHGRVGTKAELTQYRVVLVAARDRVAALKKQGKSLEEVVAAKPLAEYDAMWGAGFMPAAKFVALVYQGV